MGGIVFRVRVMSNSLYQYLGRVQVEIFPINKYNNNNKNVIIMIMIMFNISVLTTIVKQPLFRFSFFGNVGIKLYLICTPLYKFSI